MKIYISRVFVAGNLTVTKAFTDKAKFDKFNDMAGELIGLGDEDNVNYVETETVNRGVSVRWP